MNEHLTTMDFSNEATLQDVRIEIPMSGQQFGGQGSAHVEEGNYELTITKARPVRSKKSEGVNLRVEKKISGPPGAWLGKKIVSHHAVPIGHPGDPEFDKRLWMLQNLGASIASGQGRLEAVKQMQTVGLVSGQLAGKKCYAHIIDNEYEGRVNSQVGYYMDAMEYAQNAGPQGAQVDSTQATTATAATATRQPTVMAQQKAQPSPIDIFAS
jgi:hypothetical protein